MRPHLDDVSEVEDAGVVDQDVDAAEMGNGGGGDHGVVRCLIRDVELDAHAVVSKLRCEGLGARLVQVGDDDLRPFTPVHRKLCGEWRPGEDLNL